MGDTSIELWMNRHQYDALERILTERGTNIETVMQARFIELYRQTVPEQERVNISNQIESERLAAEQREVELRRFSVFRITEKGSTVCLECNHAFNFMQAANQTRRYLRQEMDPQPGAFAEYFLRSGARISEEKFSVLVVERIDGSHNITGLCDIDLDSGMFHTAHHLEGWASFRLKDVTTAAYHAYRKGYRSNDEMWRIFLDYLDGRQITEASAAIMRNSSIYVAQLPAEIQAEIRAEITASLTAAGDFTEDNLQRAMNSRLSDLDEVLDIGKYTESVHAMELGQG